MSDCLHSATSPQYACNDTLLLLKQFFKNCTWKPLTYLLLSDVQTYKLRCLPA